MALTSCGKLDVYDRGGGSILVAWPPFSGGSFSGALTADSNLTVDAPGTVDAGGADSYNVYLNGVLNQNVVIPLAVISGLSPASYNGSVETPAASYKVRVVAVSGGLEVAGSLDATVTVQPTNVTLVTPMPRGRFPFPNTPGGY